MRRISFGLTQRQFEDDEKDVTRRLGWKFVKLGDQLRAVDRVMGLRKGQKATELGVIEVVKVTREQLDAITSRDVEREGFPGKSAQWFVEFFCKHMRCEADTLVTRIEFRKVDV